MSRAGTPILPINEQFKRPASDFTIKPLENTDYFAGSLKVDMICKGSILNLL